jgi:ABC-type phosphate/phosphonate transport system substrate-binding protein
MYDVCPQARQAWAALLESAFEAAHLQPEFIEHGWPLPLTDLWGRHSLGAAFMCGWPFAKAVSAQAGIQPLASVVPAWPAYQGQARYRSEFLVRREQSWSRLEDSFGARYGWMVADSQSGWNGPRDHLRSYAPARGGELFAEAKGPYGNPAGLLAALAGGDIDVTAVDGWYLDLLRAHRPELLAGFKTLAYTAWAPNPLLVCSADIDEPSRRALESALLRAGEDERGRSLLSAAHVGRFRKVDAARYRALEEMETRAVEGGYPLIR